MGKRMEEGLKLYKKGQVEVDLDEDDLKIFYVQGSGNDKYQVSMQDNLWLCDCDDYQWRSEKEPGSYICKHLWAVFFKTTESKTD
ncbi:SWIM zinc finger family protein [Methanobacterium sp. ACI-7]|uniref:SWIM zinc finger family protein n=1 Tax=unclassified Methanobacterium TaxID=2627676 RepID=UPI0039C2F0EA